MAQILPRDLTSIPGGTISPAAAIIVDNGDGVFKGTPTDVVNSGAPVNSQGEAEAGVVNTGRMSPLRVKQAIDALGVSQDVLAAPPGGEMVGFKQDGAGSVPRSIAAKTKEQLSTTDKGAVIDGTTDDSDALIDTFAQMAVTGRANLLSGTYKVTQPLVIPPGIIEGGNVVLDFSTANPVNFPNGICVHVQGGARTQIANLDTDLVIGDRVFSFAAAHGLSVGDTFNVSGTVQYAGNGWRSYYYKGEMFRVAAKIDDTTVEVENACRDTYPFADVQVWKRSGDRFTQGCAKLSIIAPDTIDFPLYFESLDQLTTPNLNVIGGDNTAISFDDCYGGGGEGIFARQDSDTHDGYGVALYNCQGIRLRGTVYGFFNGFTVGGNGGSGKAGMNRDNHFEGLGGSDRTGGLSGANLHGNSEYCSIRGVFTNGVSLGGNWNEAYGTFISSNNWSPLLISELHGATMTIRGEVIITSGSDLPTTIGAIHQSGFGANSAAPGTPSTARYGGIADVDIALKAPKATRLMIWRPTDLARTDVILRLGLDIMQAHASTRIIAMQRNATGNEWPLLEFKRLNIVDNAVAINWSIPNAASMKIRGLRRSKSVTVAGTGNTVTQAVTFSPGFPRTPVFVVTNQSSTTIGSVKKIVGVSTSPAPSATGCTIQVTSSDNSSQTYNDSIAVTASLEEE